MANMLYYRIDDTVYANRKELRDKIGINKYKREAKRNNIIYLSNDANCKLKENLHNHYGTYNTEISRS